MNRKERQLVEAIRDAADNLLGAKNYAEGYWYRIKLADAVFELHAFSAEASQRKRAGEGE